MKTQAIASKLRPGKWFAALSDNANVGIECGTKREAEQHVQVAEALENAFRAAGTKWPTKLDYLINDAASDVIRAKQRLADQLRDSARHTLEDAERVEQGGKPWYSVGQYTRSAADLDAAHAELLAAWNVYRKLSYVVRHMEPQSDAALAFSRRRLPYRRGAPVSLKPGQRVASHRPHALSARERLGTLEGLDGSIARVIWDNGLGPYRMNACGLVPTRKRKETRK